MDMIRGTPITAAELVATNVAVDAAAYDAGTTYTLGAQSTHDAHLWISLQAGNIDHTPGDPSSDLWWLDAGADNPMRMFDDSVRSQSVQADSIEVEVTIPDVADTVALLNISAATASLTVTDDDDGVVFTDTYDLVSDDGIDDFWPWFFSPPERRDYLLVQDLPPYPNATYEIGLFNAGSDVACGVCIIGMNRRLGGTQYGARVGIIDYSTKDVDAFGNDIVVERAYAAQATFAIWTPKSQVDAVYAALAEVRTQSVLFVGDVEYGSTFVYGFWRECALEIAYPTVSLLSLDVKGRA